jgi:hypothetical protein
MNLFAPKAQQIEGLKSMLGLVSFSTFLASIERLTATGMLTKSHKGRLISWARDILGISYEHYNTKYRPNVPHYKKTDWRLDNG